MKNSLLRRIVVCILVVFLVAIVIFGSLSCFDNIRRTTSLTGNIVKSASYIVSQIASDYDMEIWQEPLPPMRFLGYEYSPMPLDVQIISDIEWHKPFETYRQLLNEHGLFSSYEHAVEFAKVYQSVAAMGEVGDGLEDAYICRVSEVESSNMCIEEKVRKVIP